MIHPITFKLFISTLLIFGAFSCSKRSELIAKINYDFQGCFGGDNSSLLIYESDTTTIAKLEKEGNVILKAKLSSAQIDTFEIFIRDLKNLSEESGCTNVSKYTVIYHNETIQKTDGSCDWNGFDKLKDCLFRNPFQTVQVN